MQCLRFFKINDFDLPRKLVRHAVKKVKHIFFRTNEIEKKIVYRYPTLILRIHCVRQGTAGRPHQMYQVCNAKLYL
jgi:hypothetical protein